MNKYKIAGFIIAVVLLAVGIISKYAGGENAAVISLPLMTVGLWVMMAVDTISYNKNKSEGLNKGIDFARLAGGYILTVIITAGTVIYIIFR